MWLASREREEREGLRWAARRRVVSASPSKAERARERDVREGEWRRKERRGGVSERMSLLPLRSSRWREGQERWGGRRGGRRRRAHTPVSANPREMREGREGSTSARWVEVREKSFPERWRVMSDEWRGRAATSEKLALAAPCGAGGRLGVERVRCREGRKGGRRKKVERREGMI